MACVLASACLARQTPTCQDPSARMTLEEKVAQFMNDSPAIDRLGLPRQAGRRLPVTFFKSADQLPPFTDYYTKGRTYRFFTGEPQYPIGHGLSYTTFAYWNLILPAHAKADAVKVNVEVRNTGTWAGDEVAQLYLRASGAVGAAPLRWLAGFERVALRAGEAKQVEFSLSARRLSSVHANGRRIVQPGMFEISVGGKQPGGLEAATTTVVTGNVQIAGQPKELI